MDFSNKKVFLRCDFNLPLKNNKVTSDLRIRQALQTIEFILSQHPKQLILASHLGRPLTSDASLSLKIILPILKKYLGKPVYFHKDVYEPLLPSKKIVLLENLRFWPQEQKSSKSFSLRLKKFADIYVNDAFGTAHRKDASVYTLPKLFPSSKKTCGFLMQKELDEIHFHQQKPLVFILGPAKIKDKLPLFEKVFRNADKVLLGGGVVFTFLKAQGFDVGKSLLEPKMVPKAKELLKKYSKKILLPKDFLAIKPNNLSKPFSQRKKLVHVVDAKKIPSSMACLDLGPKSIELFSQAILFSKTIMWNGPVGFFEISPFDKGTKALAKTIILSKAHSVICGGDTASAMKKTSFKEQFSHISTGGGASLYVLSGKKLPALIALEK